MINMWKWFLSIVAGLALTLSGLLLDAIIHSQAYGHVIFGIGLVLTTWIALAGLTLSRFDAQGHAPRWRAWSIPIAAWLMAGLLGGITLRTMTRA